MAGPAADLHVGAYGPGLIWDGDIDDAMFAEVERRGARELHLWRSDQRPLGSLARLAEISGLLGLTLLPGRPLAAPDWAVLGGLGSLRYVTHGHERVSGAFDVGQLRQLESLCIPWWPGLTQLDVPALRQLKLDRWKSAGEPLGVAARTLEVLMLWRSDIRDLRCIAHLRNVRCLCLFDSRSLASLDGVEQLEALEEVSIDGSKNTLLKDLSPLTRCRQLKRIQVHGCPSVESFPFADLPQLEAVWLWGTPVRDGKLAWLADSRTLLHANIQKHRHYDIDVDRLPRAPVRMAYRTPPTYEFLLPAIVRYQDLLAMEFARTRLYPRWFREQHPDMCHGL